VRARERRSVDELPFVDAEDVIEEEAPVDEVEAKKKTWSTLDALVVAVAVLTIVLSALALAWFLVS